MSVRSLCVLILIVLQACSTAPVKDKSLAYELLPMYGGVSLSQPKLQRQSQKVIANALKKYGNRKHASKIYSDYSFDVYNSNQYIKAMLHFNYAWILDPDNGDVYWGYALLYRQQGKHCEARQFLDIAISTRQTNPNPMWLADAGLENVLCTMTNKTMQKATREAYLDEADIFFNKAVSVEPENNNIYNAWAHALYRRGEYRDAWDKVRKQIATGGVPNGNFVSSLTLKIRKPATENTTK